MMLMAQISVPPEIVAWLGCAAFVLVMVDKAVGLKAKLMPPSMSKHEISPQPLEVRAVADMARERDCVARHQALQEQLVELRSQRITDAKDGAFSRKGLYEALDAMKREMADMERRINTADEGRTAGVWKQLNEILEALGEVRGELKSR